MAAAPKIVIPKKLEDQLRQLADPFGKPQDAPSLARQLIARIDDARALKETKTGMNPFQVVAIAKAHCPIVTPPTLTPALLSRIKQKVALLGLTDELIQRAAIRARHTLRLPVGLMYFVSQLDTLIAEQEADGGPEQDSEGEPVISIGRG